MSGKDSGENGDSSSGNLRGEAQNNTDPEEDFVDAAESLPVANSETSQRQDSGEKDRSRSASSLTDELPVPCCGQSSSPPAVNRDDMLNLPSTSDSRPGFCHQMENGNNVVVSASDTRVQHQEESSPNSESVNASPAQIVTEGDDASRHHDANDAHSCQQQGQDSRQFHDRPGPSNRDQQIGSQSVIDRQDDQHFPEPNVEDSAPQNLADLPPQDVLWHDALNVLAEQSGEQPSWDDGIDIERQLENISLPQIVQRAIELIDAAEIDDESDLRPNERRNNAQDVQVQENIIQRQDVQPQEVGQVNQPENGQENPRQENVIEGQENMMVEQENVIVGQDAQLHENVIDDQEIHIAPADVAQNFMELRDIVERYVQDGDDPDDDQILMERMGQVRDDPEAQRILDMLIEYLDDHPGLNVMGAIHVDNFLPLWQPDQLDNPAAADGNNQLQQQQQAEEERVAVVWHVVEDMEEQQQLLPGVHANAAHNNLLVAMHNQDSNNSNDNDPGNNDAPLNPGNVRLVHQHVFSCL